MIHSLNRFINVKDQGKMDDGQIEETAEILVDKFYFFNLAECHLFMKGLKSGEYGKFFGKVDGTDIIEAAYVFREKRGKVASALEIKKQGSTPMAERSAIICAGLANFNKELKIRSNIICGLLQGIKNRKWIGEAYGITWAGVDDIDVADLVRIEAALPCWAYKDNEDDGFVYIEGADIYLNEEYLKVELIN
jgi:hypothetical protein